MLWVLMKLLNVEVLTEVIVVNVGVTGIFVVECLH